jgi:circadian clock protein KaiC
MDIWLALREIEHNGERNRGIYVLKFRGKAHSNQIREFLLTDRGIELIDVYVGPEGLLTGSARAVQEMKAEAAAVEHQEEIGRRKRELERKRQAMESQIALLRAGYEAEAEDLNKILAQEKERQEALIRGQKEVIRLRQTESA